MLFLKNQSLLATLLSGLLFSSALIGAERESTQAKENEMVTQCDAVITVLNNARSEQGEKDTAAQVFLSYAEACAINPGLCAYDCVESDIIPTLESIYEGTTAAGYQQRAIDLLLGLGEGKELKKGIIAYIKELGQAEIYNLRDIISDHFEATDSSTAVRYLFRVINVEERNRARRAAARRAGEDEPSDEEAGSDSEVDPDEAIVDENADEDDK